MHYIFIVTLLYSVAQSDTIKTLTFPGRYTKGDTVKIDTLYSHDTIIVDDTSVIACDSVKNYSIVDTLSVVNDSVAIHVDTLQKDSLIKSNRKRKVEKNRSDDGLYPGITKEQDKLATQCIHEIYSFNWDEAERIGVKMQKLEIKNKLPPLSSLLMVSMRIVRIQNSEFENDSVETVLMHETDSLIKDGLERSNVIMADTVSRSTYLFIYSGIEGFSATLKIGKRPIDAAIEGFDALKKLEKLTETDTVIKDVYLGLGIFYCALSKAPPIVRGALNMTGREISFEKGLSYLRISAYHGRYTTETAKQYLIQFLSPYMGHEAAEKNQIFKSLEHQYPKNPFYLFHHIHEDICFHPENVTKVYVDNTRKKVAKFKNGNYSINRYLTLTGYQYNYLDTTGIIFKDTTFKLREFTFYPIFLNALKEKDSLTIKRERFKKMYLTSTGARAAKLLDESLMSVNRKSFFMWYLRDSLRGKKEEKTERKPLNDL